MVTQVGTERYIPAVAVIFNSDNKVLLARRYNPERAHSHAKWNFPGGSIDYGEHPKDTAIRETKEEVGLTIKALSDRPIIEVHTRDEVKIDYIILAFVCEYVHGDIDLTQDEETTEAKWFAVSEINFEETLPKTKEIIEKAMTIRKELQA